MRKNLFINIALIFVALFLFLWLVFMGMGIYTRHNQSVTVPNLKGVKLDDAIAKLEDANLRYEIFDSVYNADFKKDAITEQDPESGNLVKPGRIIYLSVNSLAKPKVKMPKLIDQSFALSKAVLKSVGLELGEVTFKYDEIGNNLVMEQLYNGSSIPPGRQIEKGSKIDLVVATNRRAGGEPTSDSTDIPMPIDDAVPNDEINP